MKNIYNKLLYTFIGASVLLFSCSPDSPELGGILSESKLDISITQNKEKDNIIYLENKTPGVISFWDYGIGYSNNPIDTVSIRFAGEYEIKLSAMDRGGTVTTSRKVIVSQNDEDYFQNPIWNMLTNGSEGKTWVWNDQVPACYGNGGFGSTAPEWWQVSYDGVIEEGWDIGDMVFDLDKAYNFTKTLTDGTKTTGFFNLDIENMRLTISGANILHGADYASDGANGNYYAIMKLTDTEMVLARQADGWQNTWMFRLK